MDKIDIIRNITERTGGDIYLGVVGAVRTGKSTFIKRFLENLIVPNIEDEYERKRTLDEIPQSAAGKTIMTTEPKFVPSNATKIKIDDIITIERNNEYKIIINLKKGIKLKGSYTTKYGNINIETTAKEITKEKNTLKIVYDLTVNDEYIDTFSYYCEYSIDS